MELWKSYKEKPVVNEMVIVYWNDFIYRAQYIQMTQSPLGNNTIGYLVLFRDKNLLASENSDYRTFIDWDSFFGYWVSMKNFPFPDQPERSKREDSQKCEMRCSEHCGNTVRDK